MKPLPTMLDRTAKRELPEKEIQGKRVACLTC